MRLSRSIIALMVLVSVFMLSTGLSLAADSKKASTPPVEEKSLKTKALETGAGLLQAQRPLDAMGVYLDGFHLRNGHMEHQMEAHHFCAQLNEDVIQCTLFDANNKEARLIGVEYVISEKLFKSLPEAEKTMWHSHVYEVKSGMLVAPGLPEVAEHELMSKLISTYGKTWHTWNMDSMGKNVPLGVPDLMMGFTADGQMDPALGRVRDSQLGISSEAKKNARNDIAAPAIQPGADAWTKGKAVELELKPLKTKK
jgi:hypothetical protein